MEYDLNQIIFNKFLNSSRVEFLELNESIDELTFGTKMGRSKVDGLNWTALGQTVRAERLQADSR